LLDAFGDIEGGPHVFVNDPDQDVCLAVWLLRNPALCRDLEASRPLARLLVFEDIMDCTAGAFPIAPDQWSAETQAWVFAPYTSARQGGKLRRMDAERMAELIGAVGERISAHARGIGSRMPLDTRMDVIGGGPGWKLIVEKGPHGRTALFAQGVRAFAAATDCGDGTWTYSIGRMSPFIHFPLEELYTELDAAEAQAGGQSGWGGSNTIGGSPRATGSLLPPTELERVVNGFLARGGAAG